MARLAPHDLLPALAAAQPVRRGWVAFSGGLDSTVLLHLLAMLRPGLAFELRAVHLDHRLQDVSRYWVRHCRLVCQGLAVPFTHLAIPARAVPGESPEAAARTARYTALAGLIGPDDLVLTAHHQDDQAETLLLALLRGSGIAGLAGMPAILPLGPGRLARPLLNYRRADLLAYAERAQLTWIEDPSNALLDLDRNRLRHEILPRLRQRWPSVTKTLARSASHCAEAARIIDRVAAEQVAELSDGQGALSIPSLRVLAPELRRVTLRQWVRECGLPVPDQAHLERVLREVIAARADADPLVAWPGGEIRRYRERLFALPPFPPCPPAECAIAWPADQDLILPTGLGRLGRRARHPFECDTATNRASRPGALADVVPAPSSNATGGLERPLSVRFAVTGLRWRPDPARPSRSLRRLFQEGGVPPWLRPYCPLVFADGDLVAVPGLDHRLPHSGSGSVVWTGHPWEGLGLVD